MPARFVNIDHDTPLLLPPDLRDWVPADHLVHFLMDAVGLLDLSAARINHRGGGARDKWGQVRGRAAAAAASNTRLR